MSRAAPQPTPHLARRRRRELDADYRRRERARAPHEHAWHRVDPPREDRLLLVANPVHAIDRAVDEQYAST
jgi:hypothetical protein